MLVRRLRPCFLSIDETPLISLEELLRAEISTFTESNILAASFTRGHEVPLSEEALTALLALSDREWEPADRLCKRTGVSANCLQSLIDEGLVLSVTGRSDDANSPSDPLEGISTWNKYAVLYHFMNKWEDMHLQIDLPQERERLTEIMSVPEAVFAEFVDEHGRPPPAFKTLEGARFSTPLPLTSPSGGLFEALRHRKTTRSFDPERGLTLEQFSTLVYYSFGCHGYSPVFRDIIGLKKTSPSGGCLHPIEVYPLVMNVAGVRPGIYHYNVENHRLDAVKALDEAEAREFANVVTAGQSFPRWSAVLFILTARFYRNHWKYRSHPRAHVVLYMDAAHLSQTHYLISAELGLGAFFTAAINGKNVEDALGLDPYEEGALAVCGCGVPASGGSVDPDFLPFVPGQTATDSR